MTGLFHEALLTGQVKISAEKSFYTSYGDIFALTCIVISLLAVGRSVLVMRRDSRLHEGLASQGESV
jgi:apolipoprotein N-acyltransferase